MPSTYKPYNKRQTVTINGKEVDRTKVNFLLREVEEFPDTLLASDRAYAKMPDGSLRRIKGKPKPKTEMVKIKRS